MKTLTTALVCAVLILAGTVAADDKPWFDMEGCAFCKQIGAEKGLAEHMRHEYHHLTNGLLSITMVDEDATFDFDDDKNKAKAILADVR